MPIANCIIKADLKSGAGDLISRWADLSDVAANLLTVNFIEAGKQLGERYDVMVTLLLPTAWSKQQAALIQSSLASALAEYFAIEITLVHIVTQWVESGDAVENGEQVSW